jgi:hypothetical protein
LFCPRLFEIEFALGFALVDQALPYRVTVASMFTVA